MPPKAEVDVTLSLVGRIPRYSLDVLWAMWQPAMAKMVAEARVVTKLDIDAQLGRLPEIAAAKTEIVDGVAVIDINGPMRKGGGGLFALLFGGADTSLITEQVNQAVANGDVSKILLRIDSPGGSVDGVHELASAVAAANETKPVTAQVSGTAASAAFWVASQAHQVFAGEMDMVGSIGAIIIVEDSSEMFANMGVEVTALSTGKHKETGHEGLPIDDEQKAELQKLVDAFGDKFVSAVAKGRGMSKAAVSKLADGRMFLAAEAKANGLIDGVQGFDATLGKMQASTRRRRAAKAKLALAGVDAEHRRYLEARGVG